jgi:hypothetical protein
MPARPLAAALLAAVAAVAFPGAAPAAGPEGAGRLPCTGFEHLSGFLKDSYGERPVSTGLQSNGQILQIFSSAETGSWTAVSTDPAGLACVVATGRYWEQQAEGDASRAYKPAALR